MSDQDTAGSAPGVPDLPTLERRLLGELLASANKIARRLRWSQDRVGPLMPLDAAGVDALTHEDDEKLDAFIMRFNSLTETIQDSITKALLKVEEEEVAGRSRKDQRLLLEKLGALDPALNFGNVAELRNRLAHHYPDDTAKQAEVLTAVYKRSGDLIAAYNSVLQYSDKKFFAHSLDVHAIETDAPAPAP